MSRLTCHVYHVTCHMKKKNKKKIARSQNGFQCTFYPLSRCQVVFTKRLFKVLSGIELSGFEVLKFCHYLSSEFCHNLSFCVLSQFEFLSFLTIWALLQFEFLSCTNLRFFSFVKLLVSSFVTIQVRVLSQFELSFSTIWFFKLCCYLIFFKAVLLFVFCHNFRFYVLPQF